MKTGGQFEVPTTKDGDKCMPPLLFRYSPKIKAGQSQPDANYQKGASCAFKFDPARVTAYEKANSNFQEDMKKPGAESIPLLRDQLVMDIAYLQAS